MGPFISIMLTVLLSRDADTRERVLSFSVTDERPEMVVNVGRDIVVHVRRAVDAKGRHFGWDFSAVDRRLKKHTDFFYDCLCGHGTSLNNLYAWHFSAKYYPAERLLPVYGYPFNIRVQCVGCEVEGARTTEVRFTRGMVHVRVQRLAAANPRQRTVRDLVRRRR